MDLIQNRADLQQLQDQFMSFALERALSGLRCPVHLMNTGAHPDDEHSALLAWLRFARGIEVTTLSATRGQGGQNRISSASGPLLGVLRSYEMQRAASVLDANHIWLDEGGEDRLTDFGFSKSGVDSFARWGGQATVIDRMVRVYRRTRPDIVLPTFLDVPGQHGHHRAMTQAALAGRALAADRSYLTDDLAPWQIAKMYLPAWSGAGSTYDDESPPPPTTLTLRPGAEEPWTGAPWALIGETARLAHASQDMGDPSVARTSHWALHLLGGGCEDDILDNLPHCFGELSGAPLALRQLDLRLEEAQTLRDAALVRGLDAAACLLEEQMRLASPEFLAANGHRLQRLKRALHRAVMLAVGQLPRCLRSDQAYFQTGEVLRIASDPPTEAAITLHLPQGFRPAPAEGGLGLIADASAAPLPAFVQDWDCLGGNGAIFAEVQTQIEDGFYRSAVEFDVCPMFLPNSTVECDLPLIIQPKPGQAGEWSCPLPNGMELELSQGVTWQEGRLQTSAALAQGYYRWPAQTAKGPALKLRSTQSATGAELSHLEPLYQELICLDLKVPQGRLAYLPGSENLDPIFDAMGMRYDRINGAASLANLLRYDSLLIGAAAFGRYAWRAQELQSLRDWVGQGGILVTLYQRPDQGWPRGGLGFEHLDIGQPSLRWRVTDPEAPITILTPEAQILKYPNPIDGEDWQNWHKDRGLYFASEWGPMYQAVLKCADPNEPPLFGGLVSGQFGKGRHSHVSLSLHHQLACRVPGAFRLLANLLTPTQLAFDNP